MYYLSQCPHCATIYQLDRSTLSLAQGKVRCIECQRIFNAYHNFIETQCVEPEQPTELFTSCNKKQNKKFNNVYQEYIENFLAENIPHSQLDLYQYLNMIKKNNKNSREVYQERLQYLTHINRT